ncbi:DUF4395 domain-containing protein [Mucilaginibacter gynuensis]
MNNNISCPVDHVKVNENKIRVVALLVLLCALAYLGTGMQIIPVLLTIDFLLRSTGLEKYSVLASLAGIIANAANLKVKPVDRAPKRFAAWVGFVFMAAVCLVDILGMHTTAPVLATIVCVFAALESFVAFCAGCYVYHYGVKVLGILKNGN